MGRDHVLDLLGLHHAHMAVHQLPVLIEVDRGHGGDAELPGNLRIVGGVELDDVQKGNLRLI